MDYSPDAMTGRFPENEFNVGRCHKNGTECEHGECIVLNYSGPMGGRYTAIFTAEQTKKLRAAFDTLLAGVGEQ
jgi:hypothetical protein